ncbi:MAG: DUF1028 domain-containing protein [Gammaproteobacteria bacterium]|nr:DUF1028 domain-containing protein [Gammaproteobacteria bacterium]
MSFARGSLDNQFTTHTGSECEPESKHIIGKHCVASGNSLVNTGIIDHMVAIFEKSASEPLSQRLVRVIAEAEKSNADKRGKQSAALKIIAPNNIAQWYMYPDLRVDDHEYPAMELSRLLALFIEQQKKWS